MAKVQAAPPLPPRPRWQVPLLVGFCFGLGYGLTHRLLALQWPSLVQLGQGFEVRPFPGTSLESLRLRFGADSQELRGDLDLLELQQQDGAKPAVKPADPAEAGMDLPLERQPATTPPVRPRPAAETSVPPPPPQLPPPTSQPDLPQFTPDAGLR